MRTPWRFLADLRSRRKPQQPLLPPPTPEARTDEPDDQRASGVPDTLDHPGTSKAADTTEWAVPADASAEVDDTTPAAGAAVSDPEPSPRAVDEPGTEAVLKRGDEAIVSSTGKKRPKRIELPGTKRQTSTAPLHGDVGEPQPVPPARPSFLDEVMTLDSEIAELRAALAQRLTQQNAQLRKMLERFEVR